MVGARLSNTGGGVVPQAWTIRSSVVWIVAVIKYCSIKVGWLVGWLVGVGWLVLVGWLVGWLVGLMPLFNTYLVISWLSALLPLFLGSPVLASLFCKWLQKFCVNFMCWKDVDSPNTMEISCLNKDFKYQVNVVNSMAYLLAFPASYWTDNGAKWKNRFKILLI